MAALTVSEQFATSPQVMAAVTVSEQFATSLPLQEQAAECGDGSTPNAQPQVLVVDVPVQVLVVDVPVQVLVVDVPVQVLVVDVPVQVLVLGVPVQALVVYVLMQPPRATRRCSPSGRELARRRPYSGSSGNRRNIITTCQSKKRYPHNASVGNTVCLKLLPS
jgi:hypothetical protein